MSDDRALPYPDLVSLNTKRTILDGVGADVLEGTVSGYLSVLETAMTVFEANGDYATGARPHGWCRLVDEVSRPPGDANDAMEAIASGRWSCRAACRRPALEAMEGGAPADFRCPFGLLVHAAPIFAGSEVVGSISVACGKAPTGDEQPPNVALARQAVDAAARLFGEMIARRRDEAERERAREIFTAMVAHDLRSPLSAIRTGADVLLLKTRVLPDELADRMAQRIRRSAERMSRMVEDLLDLARVRVGGGVPLRRERHSLAVLVSELIEEVRLVHPAHEVRFQGDGDTTIECDADRIREVIENLLLNAIRYGSQSPVDVNVSGSPDAVVLRVRNAGPVIPAEVLPTIFSAFARGEERRPGERSPARSGGLGLGLFIVHEFVRAHGGSVDVESAVGTGTCFTVTLPQAHLS